MSDNYVSSISGPVDRSYANNLQAEKYSGVRKTESSEARGDPKLEPAVQQKAAQPLQGRKPGNVHLQFKIDPDTNDITVIVMDKESEQVIRTIPPEELSELVEGDLLEVLT